MLHAKQCGGSARGGVGGGRGVKGRKGGSPVLVLLAGAVCSAEKGAVDLIVLAVPQLIGYA